MHHEESATFQKPRYGSEYMSSDGCCFFGKSQFSCGTEWGATAGVWWAAGGWAAPGCWVQKVCLYSWKMRFVWESKQSFTFIKPTIYILLYVQSFNEVQICIYTIWIDIFDSPFYASSCFQLCWNVIFICLLNVASMAVRLESMRLFLRLIIHSLFCCSWEIYD